MCSSVPWKSSRIQPTFPYVFPLSLWYLTTLIFPYLIRIILILFKQSPPGTRKLCVCLSHSRIWFDSTRCMWFLNSARYEPELRASSQTWIPLGVSLPPRKGSPNSTGAQGYCQQVSRSQVVTGIQFKASCSWAYTTVLWVFSTAHEIDRWFGLVLRPHPAALLALHPGVILGSALRTI